jgi:hypothetical protein
MFALWGKSGINPPVPCYSTKKTMPMKFSLLFRAPLKIALFTISLILFGIEGQTQPVKQSPGPEGSLQITENGSSPLPTFFEDFNQVTAPDLPEGWSNIEITSGNATVRTVTIGNPHSPPNHVRFQNSTDGNATLLLISPQVNHFQSNWLRFWASMSSAIHNEQVIVGYMSAPGDVALFTPVDTILVEGDVYRQHSVLFPEHLNDNDTYHIAFRFLPGSTFRNLYVDDVSWQTRPAGPVVEFIPTGLDFWVQQFETISGFQEIRIKNDGAESFTLTPEDITITGPDAADFIFTNLEEPIVLPMGGQVTIEVAFSPLTIGQKQAYLEVKGFQAPLSGIGADAMISQLPHFEDFDDITPPNLPFGWHKIVNNPTYTSAVVETTTLTGPLSAPNHARINSNDDTEADMLLISPPISDLPAIRVNFGAKSNLGSNVPDLIVGTMTDPDDAATFVPFYTIPGGGSGVTNQYKEFIVTFNTSVPDTAHVAFKHGGTPSGNRSLFIDDVLFEETPGGPGTLPVTFLIEDDSDDSNPLPGAEIAIEGQPVILSDNQGLAQTYLLPGNYQANVTLEGYVPATVNFEVENDPVSLTVILEEIPIVYYTLTLSANPPEGGTVTGSGEYEHNQQVTIEATPAPDFHFVNWTNEQGLLVSSQPQYTFPMPMEDLKLIANFQETGLITDFPWLETFDEDSESRQYWTQNQIIGNQNWTFATGSSGGSISQPFSGLLNARFTSSQEGGTTLLITPLLDISGLDEPRLVFWYGQQVWSGDQNELRVLYRTGPETSWIEIFHSNQNVPEWTRMTLALPEASETYQVAFEGTDNWGRANVIDHVSVEETPEFHEITFLVVENAPEEAPVANATVTLQGFPPALTSDSGEVVFMLEDLTYQVNVSRSGYQPETLEITVDGEPATVIVRLNDLITEPFNLEVLTEGLEPGEALLRWNDTGDTWEFRYDNGMLHGQTGFEGNLNSVMGSVHRNNAELNEIAWVLTNTGGPHHTVKVWILGLTAHGLPDRNNVLYTAENVPNTDNQWTTYQLSEVVSAPEGFFVGLSYDGFIGLAVDNGMVNPWNFQPNTHFGAFDITDPAHAFTDISEWNVERNFMLRAYGKNLGPVKSGSLAAGTENSAGPPVIYSDVDKKPFEPQGHPAESGLPKVFTGFNVFLNDMGSPVAEGLVTNDYLFTGLEEGNHTAGVQAVYSTGTSAIVETSFTIGPQQPLFTLQFSVSDTDGTAIADARITLEGNTYDPGVYTFNEVEPGEYSYAVAREGFETVSGTAVIDQADLLVEITMIPDDVSVPGMDSGNISIYPNPARNILHVNGQTKISRIRIFDLLGQMVYATDIPKNHHTIDLMDFMDGIYIIQVFHEGGFSSHRIQITK